MIATVIKSLNNIGEEVEIKSGKPVYTTFEGVNFENAVIIINGHTEKPDYIIKDNDIVTLRLLPADLTDTPWWVSTFIIPFGFIIQPAEIAYQARQQAEEAERELEKIKKLTNGAEIDNRPFLRGASNTLATGKSQPYFCGRNFLTPYLFSKPFYKITGTDGAEQELYTILEGGFRNIVLNKIGIGDTTIKSFDEQTPQNGTYNINDGLFADGLLEIKQDGELFENLPELNYKTISNVINKEIEKQVKIDAGEDEYLYFDIDPNAKNIEIAINFPYGLYAYNNDNNKIETQVEIIPEYSLDGGENYTVFTFDGGSNIFKKNTAKEIRYIAKQDFTLADYVTLHNNNQTNIIIRLRSNGNDDQKIKNDCYLYYYQSQIFDPNKSSIPAGVLNDNGAAGLVSCLNIEDRERAYSCVIGLKLKATKNNEKKLTQINIIATSAARTWTGTEWSPNKTPTRNPAAIAVEVLTSDIHPASRYDDSEDDSEIDLEAWGALYDKCERDGIKFDYVITQNQRKNDTLQKIADICNAAIYKDIYGRISVAIDQAQENALAVYNPQNIISISNKKTFSRRVDALRIKYIDSKNDNFKENTYVVTRVENGQPVTIDENSIIKEISVTGITEYEQIVKYGRRLMAVDELRQITTTIKIGQEGVYYTPCARVKIQDSSLNRDAQDAVIERVEYYGGLLQKIILKNPVTFDANKSYGAIVNCNGENGAHPLALKVTGSGRTKELIIDESYSISEENQPTKNNALSFGELDENGEFSKITHDYIITRISRAENGYNLDLQEYNEAIYDTGEIPAYKPIINNTATPSTGEIPANSVTHEELDKAVTAVNSDTVQAAVDTIQKGYRFTNIYNVRPVDMSLEDIIARMDDDARNSSASISMNADEILLQVDDMAQELTGLIDIQAGAVTALVEGGGAVGQMSLSLNLPVTITAATRAQFVTASTEAKVAAVYALVENTDYYGIKGNASNADVKALWDDAVAGGLLASQIVIDADQINLAGKTIFTSQKTQTVANAAQSNAEATASSQRNEMATKLGYASYDAMVQAAAQGQTIIDGGYLRTALIDVEDIFAKRIVVKEGGSLESSNYSANEGWKIDYDGNAKFNNGEFNGIVNASGGTFAGLIKQGCNFYIAARIIITYDGSNWNLQSNNNKYNGLIRLNKGRFAIYLPHEDLAYGLPRVITHYCSDKYESSSTAPTLGNIANNTYHPYNSNAMYQLNCSSGLNVIEYGGQFMNYLPLYFTDHNTDDFIDPAAAIISLIYV